MKKITTFIILLFVTGILYSQSYYLGAMTGYGRTTDSGEKIIFPFEKSYDKYLSISFLASYKPKKPILCFNSGLSCQTLLSDKTSMNFIKVPIGLDLLIGKKIQTLFGSGIYGQSFIFRTGDFNYDFTIFQFGFYVDLGMSYFYNEKYCFFFKIQMDYDLTKLYKEAIPFHFGGYYYENVYISNSSINIGFKYRLKNKNNAL